MSDQYDTIIIGAGRGSPSPLAPLPQGEGTRRQKQSPRFINEGW